MRASFLKTLYLLLFICVAGIPSGMALAQAEDEYDEIPDEYIEEADAYFFTCQGDSIMSQYANCACMSSAMLRERVDMGPTVPQTRILNKITKECFDAIGSTGKIYDKCLRRASRFEAGTDPEKYCECVANTYVNAMNLQKPTIRSTSMTRFESYALSYCRRPDVQMPAR